MIKVFYEDENIVISTYGDGDTLNNSFIDEKRPFGAYPNIIGRIKINRNNLIIDDFHIEAMGEKYSEVRNSINVAMKKFGYEPDMRYEPGHNFFVLPNIKIYQKC